VNGIHTARNWVRVRHASGVKLVRAQISAVTAVATDGGFSELRTCDCTGAETGADSSAEPATEIGTEASGTEIGLNSTDASAIAGGGRLVTLTRPSTRQARLACSVRG
jgi:hypothetical protein